MSETKRLIENINENLFEMANLSPKRTGLSVVIWSEQGGDKRNKPDNYPRVKVSGNDYDVVISLVDFKILAKSGDIKQSDKKDIKKAVEYIKRNSDLFLKHYNSSAFVYDDDDLKDDLRKRGEYK